MSKSGRLGWGYFPCVTLFCRNSFYNQKQEGQGIDYMRLICQRPEETKIYAWSIEFSYLTPLCMQNLSCLAV